MKKVTDELRKKIIEYAKRMNNKIICERSLIEIKNIKNNIYHIETIERSLCFSEKYQDIEHITVFFDFNIKYEGKEEDLKEFILSLNGIRGDISKLPNVTDYTEDCETYLDSEEPF